MNDLMFQRMSPSSLRREINAFHQAEADTAISSPIEGQK